MIRPLYKAQEPFMDVPMGTGYLGVVMYDDKDDKEHIGSGFALLWGEMRTIRQAIDHSIRAERSRKRRK